MELNWLYKFDFNILYDKRKIENGILKCSSTVCDMARTRVSKRDSLLFDQLNKIKGNNNLEELLVVFDFTNFIKTNTITELINVKEIELKIHKFDGEFESEKEVTIFVKDFLKSNSMSKDCQVYYLNSRVLDKNGNNLYDSIKSRVFFDFEDQETVLSKLYAYSGTLCSDCTLLENIKLNEDEIVVVDDKQYIEISDCVTMISKDFLFNELIKIKNYINQNPKIIIEELLKFNACREFDSLYNSMNNYGNNLSNCLKEIINDYYQLPKTDVRLFKLELSDLIKKYEAIGSKTGEVEWERIIAHDYPFDLNLFDGEGLISKEFCNELRNSLCEKLGNDKYKDASSFQIRLPYVKGMVHSCDFKSFFKEKGITEIAHLTFNDGKKYDVNRIKMVLTESQFKIEAFIKNRKSKVISNLIDYIRIINKYDYAFGVIDANKTEKDICSLEYQFISTLPLEAKNIRDLVKDNKWRINNLCSSENIIRQIENEDTLLAKQELAVYRLNPELYYCTDRYKRRKINTFNRLKNKTLFCKFDVKGSRRYLSSDLLEFLYFIAYYDYSKFPQEEWLYKNQFYMPSKAPRNNKSVFLRSPHYSRNEIVLLSRRPVELNGEREKYFSHLTGVVMINPRSLAAERLGGADYDGDTVLVVNDKNIVFPVIKNMISYKASTFTYKYMPCKIPSIKGKTCLYSDYYNRLNCFQNTFSSRVGLLSNEAIVKAAKIYSNHNKENNHDLMAEYTILNGLEIDSAKTGKKPHIVFGKDDDSIMSTFFKAKKEFDTSGGLKQIKALSKDIPHITGIYQYDDYWDHDDDFSDEEDELIDDNSSYDYGYNILSIVYNMNYNIELFNYDECKKFKIKKTDIKPTDRAKTLAIATAYYNASKIIKNVLSNKAKAMKKTQLNRIYDQLNEICLTKEIALDDILDNIKLDNIEAYHKLNSYVLDNEFHFLKTEKERIEYLKDFFDVTIPEKTLKELADFKGDGFRLLFILLNYFLNKISKIEICSSYIEKEKIEKLKKHIFDGDKDRCFNLYKKYESDINSIITRMIDCKEDDIKLAIVEYLKKEASSLTIDDVLYDIGYSDTNMIFDVFFDIMQDYLGGLK